jgi:glycosyltransferase involved in cell wall biosynthesis
MSLPVTVIIPTFNNRATVGDAIASVLRQSSPPEQIVVVDDGSEDDTATFVEATYGSRVELVRQANRGPSHARNRGLDLARAPYVAFLDADDVWHVDKLAVQWQLFMTHPALGTAACDWVRTPEDLPKDASFPLPVTTLRYQDLLVLNRFQTSTVLTRTALIRDAGGFDPNVDGVEDWDMWVRLAERAEMMKIDRPLVVYRDVASGYSKDLMRVYRTMERLLDKHRQTSAVSPTQFRTIEAWHHLRFAVAFLLLHDREAARMAWARGWTDPWAALMASVEYLAPFLVRRARRSR